MDLKSQVVLVTGAASGIGLAAARMFAERGSVVMAVDRNEPGVRRETSLLVSSGGRAEGHVVDVASREAVDRLVADIVARHGRLDALVHCAAVGWSKELLDVTDEEWQAVMRVNLDGSFWLGRAVGRVMAEQRDGTMVFFASDRGRLGAAQAVAYAASKGGVIALAKSLALALARFGVTVNAVNPGPTDTPMLTEDIKRARMEQDPLGRVSTPSDIAEVVAFLCGPARGFMTGQVLTTRMR